MPFNAFIVNWTVDSFDELKRELSDAGFVFEPEGEHMRAVVPLARADEFAAICQKRLHAPQNYIDLQYPEVRKTVLVFRDAVFTITSSEENARVRAWALALGLPSEQSDWAISF
jgi:hypothetical protein